MWVTLRVRDVEKFETTFDWLQPDYSAPKAACNVTVRAPGRLQIDRFPLCYRIDKSIGYWFLASRCAEKHGGAELPLKDAE